MQQLIGSIQDIIRFQKLFLDGLERSLNSNADVKVELPSLFVVNYHNYVNSVVYLSFLSASLYFSKRGAY